MTDTTDRELLELAAKADGLPYIKPLPEYDGRLGLEVGSDNPMRCRTWNPLTSCEDAMRLAVRLGLSVIHDKVGKVCAVYLGDVFYSAVAYNDDPIAATCRAIVCAAARLATCQPS